MGFAGELLGNKRNLALLSDDANRPYFTGKELALIDRMVPWTRTLAPGRVRSVHVSEPRGNLVEVCAIVQHRDRATAIALRMEGVDGRWQCTALQFG